MLTEENGLFSVKYGSDDGVVMATVFTGKATKEENGYRLPDGILPSDNDLLARFKDTCHRMKADCSIVCSPPTALALIVTGIIPKDSFVRHIEVMRPGIGKGFSLTGIPVPNTPGDKTVTVTIFNTTDAKLRKLVKDDPRFKRFSWKKK